MIREKIDQDKKVPLKSAFDFLGTITKLSKIEREIMLLLYREGRVTPEQVCRNFRNNRNNIHVLLNGLIEKGLLYKYNFHNFEFYELNLHVASSTGYERFPSGPIIPLIYHFNLLCNESRVQSFKKAIEQVVKARDVVFDLGCGTGILSVFAAKQGAYVFAVEADPIVYDAAEYFVKNLGYSDKIKVIQGDIRDLDFEKEADVVICEMLDTALIAELQIPVMNYAMKTLLKPDGRVIPRSATTSAQLVNVEYGISCLEFKLIHYEAHGSKIANSTLSDVVPYHNIYFDQENSLFFSREFSIECNHKGIANSLRITTDIHLTSDISERGSPWFNPPLVLPFEDIPVKKGNKILIKLSYEFGSGFPRIKYEVKEVKKNVRRDETD